MNPDKAIRPWLIACAKQFGVNQAHPYRWPDADTRAQVPYFTYRSRRGLPASSGIIESTTASADNTVSRKTIQPHKQYFEINLYRHDDGLNILEGCCMAPKKSPALRKLFDENNCSLSEHTEVENLTTWDNEKIDYHFQVFVTFNENVEITIDEVNGEVEQVDMTLESGDTTFEITRSGITET